MTTPAFLIHVIGCTNAGKSTLLAAAPQDWGRVEVGKTLRAKYPPSHFAGQCNPKHTAVEAWQIYLDGVAAAEAEGRRIILIDGQPRDVDQCAAALSDRHHIGLRMFLHLWAPPETRAARAHARDGADPARMALTTARLINDVPANYEVLCALMAKNALVVTVDTNANEWSTRDLVMDLGTLAQTHLRNAEVARAS
jgi:hypothetical protein